MRGVVELRKGEVRDVRAGVMGTRRALSFRPERAKRAERLKRRRRRRSSRSSRGGRGGLCGLLLLRGLAGRVVELGERKGLGLSLIHISEPTRPY